MAFNFRIVHKVKLSQLDIEKLSKSFGVFDLSVIGGHGHAASLVNRDYDYSGAKVSCTGAHVEEPFGLLPAVVNWLDESWHVCHQYGML